MRDHILSDLQLIEPMGAFIQVHKEQVAIRMLRSAKPPWGIFEEDKVIPKPCWISRSPHA